MKIFAEPSWNRRRLLQAMSVGGLAHSLGVRPAMANAPDSSPWSEGSHSALRLIQGTSEAGKPGRYLAGISIRLAPGFKTYWRHPGDSGVPPVFGFQGSGNLKEALVHFPAPKSFADGAGGTSFGYAETEVILPLTVTAADPHQPVVLQLQADYAVCEKICIPAHGAVGLILRNGLQSSFDQPLGNAMASVPEIRTIGQAGALQISALRKAPTPEHVLVDVRLPEGGQPSLLLEGESPWLFETRSFAPGPEAGAGTFTVAVIERNKSYDCTGADMVLTLVSDKAAIEVRTRLDVGLVTP